MNLYFNPEAILVPWELNVFSHWFSLLYVIIFHRRLRLDGRYDYTI